MMARDGADRAGEGQLTAVEARPPLVVVVAVAIILIGLAQVAVALSLLGWVTFLGAPAEGDLGVSGSGALVVGVLTVLAGSSVLASRTWSWIAAVVVMGLVIGSAGWAIVRHGLEGVMWVSLATGVAAVVVLAYLLQPRVRRAFRG